MNRSRKNGDKDGKALYKLVNNAVSGKTIKNLRDRADVKFLSNEKDYLKQTLKPSYMSQKVFDNDLFLMRKSEVKLTLNKPTLVSLFLLDLSKVQMYKFHYHYIKNKYGNSSRLLFTDTDSLLHKIKIKDVYEDFSKDIEMFDFSNYSGQFNEIAYSQYLHIFTSMVVKIVIPTFDWTIFKQLVGTLVTA